MPEVLRRPPRELLAGLAMLGLLTLTVSEWRGAGGLPRGTPAPPLSMPLSDGARLAIPSADAGVVVLSFWASWCSACRRETPALNLLHERLTRSGRGRVVGVNVEGDPLPRSAALARGLGLGIPVAQGSPSILAAWDVQRLPTTYIVAPSGRIVATFIGPVGTETLDGAVRRAGRPALASSQR